MKQDAPAADGPATEYDAAFLGHVAAGRFMAARQVAEASGRAVFREERGHFFALSCYLDGDMASAAEAWAAYLATPGEAVARRLHLYFPAIARACRLAGTETILAARLSRLLHACPGTQFVLPDPGEAAVRAAYRARWERAATLPSLLVASMPWSGGSVLATALAAASGVTEARFGLAEVPVRSWVADALACGGAVAASPTAFSWDLEDAILESGGGALLVLLADPRSAGCALVDAIDGADPAARFSLDAAVPDDWAQRDDAARLDWMIDGCLGALARWAEGWLLAAARASLPEGATRLRPLILDAAAVAVAPADLPKVIAEHLDVDRGRVETLVPAAPVAAPPDWRERLSEAQAACALERLPEAVRARFPA